MHCLQLLQQRPSCALTLWLPSSVHRALSSHTRSVPVPDVQVLRGNLCWINVQLQADKRLFCGDRRTHLQGQEYLQDPGIVQDGCFRLPVGIVDWVAHR